MAWLIIAVGHRMPRWIDDGFAEYAQRMPPESRITLREIKPEPRAGNRDAAALMQREAARIETARPSGSRMIALDERGQDLTTAALAESLASWQQEGGDTAFVIGGAAGLDPALKARARMLLRLSSLTLPHGMARVLLAEQIYRAWSLLQNHPYHRA